jgi:hypothetical protein
MSFKRIATLTFLVTSIVLTGCGGGESTNSQAASTTAASTTVVQAPMEKQSRLMAESFLSSSTRLATFESFAMGTNEWNVLQVAQAYVVGQKCTPDYPGLAYWVSQIGNVNVNSAPYYAAMYEIFVAGSPTLYNINAPLASRIQAYRDLLAYAGQDSTPVGQSDATITNIINGGANTITYYLVQDINLQRSVTQSPRLRNRLEVALVGSNDRQWSFKDCWAMQYTTANYQTVTDYLAWDAAGRP